MDDREQSCPGSLPDPGWGAYAAWLDGGLRFGQGDGADVLPPGPLLAGLTEEAVRDFGVLSDDELVGVLQAARRQEIRESCKQTLVIAEFARRREAAFEAAKARGVPVGCRAGGFPGEELAIELVTTPVQAGHRIETATDLVTRLPATLAGMAAGLIDEPRAAWIAYYTHGLAPADAARADEVLAAAAPGLRVDQVARRAAALEMRLDPAAARARKEHEKRAGQRVEARREASGNASLSAREMDTADAMAAKSYIDQMAAALRNGGLDAPLGALRVLAMGDLTQGRNPLDRLKPAPAEGDPPPAGAERAGNPADSPAEPGAPGLGRPGPDVRPGQGSDEEDRAWDDGQPGEVDDPLADDPAETGHRPVRRTGPVPLPALINLIVPAATLFGRGTAPAQAGSWGLLDYEETSAVVTAASRHRRTRWCFTLTNEKGEAIAHACARGRHPWTPEGFPGPRDPGGARDGPAPEQAARLRGMLGRLNLTFEPIARGTCDHRHAEDHYTPSRKLRHLVRARTATCDAPGCAAQAIHADLDHTAPYPDGPTDECNLGPKCRTHHRCKQAPDWKVEQTEPGVIRWTLPSGRTHTTTPTTYDV
jgi:Domain of unknown function (DUF222)